MPERDKFDCKDILLIVITCLLIISVIAFCVSVSSYAILNERTNISDVKTSEACIASESLEREIVDNYAMPDSNIVYYDYSNYHSDYGNIDYDDINGDVFYEVTWDLQALEDVFYIDDLPTYFQVTGIVYNLVMLIYPSVDDIWQLQETSFIVSGFESNSIYSNSYYTYELLYSWQAQESLNVPVRNSIFSAGDSIHVGALIYDYYDFVQGMEFEVEFEFEITRIYGYNLTSYIQGIEQNAYADGEQLGYQTGHEHGYNAGFTAGYTAGEGYGYNEGLNDGVELGYNSGKADGLTEGYDNGYSVGYGEGETNGYIEGRNEGYAEGYDEGYDRGSYDGYQDGYDDGSYYGYDEGYTEGYDEGYTIGRNTGFNQGVEQAGNYTFFSLITSVFDAPLRVILGEWVDTDGDDVSDTLEGGFLNFYVPVLDIDLAPLIISLFTVCIIILVLRFILVRL